MLCGLLMSHFLNWSIVGYYDTKVLALRKGIHPKAPVYLDPEINRAGVRSVGHHIIQYNHRISNQLKNSNFSECVQPNTLAGIDGRECVQQKYPFGTIHLLISILSANGVK